MRRKAAPQSAITPSSSPSWGWKRKANIIRKNITRFTLRSFLSVIDLLSFIVARRALISADV